MKKLLLALFPVVTTIAPLHAQSATVTPAQAVEELLTADREFARRATGLNVVEGISGMLAANAIMPLPGGVFAEGRDSIISALKRNPVNSVASVTWTPVRGGISADGQQGFTLGYMTQRIPDSADVPMKYLSYWVKTPEGWRVAGYKRARRPPGEVSLAMMPPALPARMVAPSNDKTLVSRYEKEVGDAERGFSAESQTIGLPAAFAKHGSADAVHLGGPAAVSFVVGAEAIGNGMKDGDKVEPSPVSWGADKVIAASSGDLGITFGIIRANAPDAEGKRGAYSFFTIWRRASTGDRWLYVAE
jgi:ketosteroid isomerase-like protein